MKKPNRGNKWASYDEPVLDERAKTHGDWPLTAFVAQGIKDAMAAPGTLDRLSMQQKEAVSMIAMKLARIASGDPNCKDHWDDIAGYAKLASKHTT